MFQAITKKEKKKIVLQVQIFSESINEESVSPFAEEIVLTKKIHNMKSMLSMGVLRTYYISLNDGQKIGVLELEQGDKNLTELMNEKIAKQEEFSPQEKNQIYLDLIYYLAFLHSENIAHCNINGQYFLYRV